MPVSVRQVAELDDAPHMLHDVLLGQVTAIGLPPVAVFAIGYPLAIGAAELSYRFFESRFYRPVESYERPS